MKLLAFISVLALTGCTTIRERGQVVFQTSSNLAGVHFQSANGTVFNTATIDNAAIHRSVGGAVTMGAMGIGAAIMTSGLSTKIK